MLLALLSLSAFAYLWLGRGRLAKLRVMQRFVSEYHRLVNDGHPPLCHFRTTLPVPIFRVLRDDALRWGKALAVLPELKQLMTREIDSYISSRNLHMQWFTRAGLMHAVVAGFTLFQGPLTLVQVRGPILLAIGLMFCLSFLLLGKPECPWLLTDKAEEWLWDLIETEPGRYPLHPVVLRLATKRALHERRLDFVPIAELFGLGLVALLLLVTR